MRWIVVLSALVACSTSQSPSLPEAPADCGPASSSVFATREISARQQAIGASPACSDPASCTASCESRAGELRTGRPGFRPIAFDSAECKMMAFDGGPSAPGCACGIGAGVIALVRHVPWCLRYGRTYQCLYRPEEFSGCALGGPVAVCGAACKDLEDRIAADAARDFQVEVHGAICSEQGCDCVLAMGGSCYWSGPQAYQCSLSPQEIVRRERERLQPAGAGRGGDSGAPSNRPLTGCGGGT
jgi:hypothetical protein